MWRRSALLLVVMMTAADVTAQSPRFGVGRPPTPAEIRELGSAIAPDGDRKSTRLNSSHLGISYAVFCLKKKKLARENVQIHAVRRIVPGWRGLRHSLILLGDTQLDRRTHPDSRDAHTLVHVLAIDNRL